MVVARLLVAKVAAAAAIPGLVAKVAAIHRQGTAGMAAQAQVVAAGHLVQAAVRDLPPAPPRYLHQAAAMGGAEAEAAVAPQRRDQAQVLH